MIQCPICHVLNEDRSLFCAECGQRFAPGPESLQGKANETNPDQALAQQHRSGPKLHSPLLGEPDSAGGSLDGSSFNPGRVTGNKFLGAGAKKVGRNTNEHQGQTVEPVAGEVISNKLKPRKGLHSPLLGGAVEEDEPEYDAPPKSQGIFPHRSRQQAPNPFPSEPDQSAPRPVHSVHKGGLRSPLLDSGVDEFIQEEVIEVRTEITSQVTPRRRLHSPVLDGTTPPGSFFNDPEAEIVEETNVLRSPLLAAKLPFPDRNTVPPPAAGLAPPVPVPSPTAPAFPPPQPMPQTQPFSPEPLANQSENSFAPGPVNFSSARDNPTLLNPTVGFPSQPSMPGPPPDFGSPARPDDLTAPPRPTITPVTSVTRELELDDLPTPQISSVSPGPSAGASPNIPSWQEGAPSLNRESLPQPPPSASSNRLRAANVGTESGAKARLEIPEPALPKSKRVNSRLLPGSEAEASVPSFEAPVLARKEKSSATKTLVLIAVVCAIAFKLWYLVEIGPKAFSSMPFLADQIGQMIVFIGLMIVSLRD